MAFRNAFKAGGTRWRYYSGQRNGAKCHTYIPDNPDYPTIRSDKRLKKQVFTETLRSITDTELTELLKEAT